MYQIHPALLLYSTVLCMEILQCSSLQMVWLSLNNILTKYWNKFRTLIWKCPQYSLDFYSYIFSLYLLNHRKFKIPGRPTESTFVIKMFWFLSCTFPIRPRNADSDEKYESQKIYSLIGFLGEPGICAFSFYETTDACCSFFIGTNFEDTRCAESVQDQWETPAYDYVAPNEYYHYNDTEIRGMESFIFESFAFN
jgi:hypothetical protein